MMKLKNKTWKSGKWDRLTIAPSIDLIGLEIENKYEEQELSIILTELQIEQIIEYLQRWLKHLHKFKTEV